MEMALTPADFAFEEGRFKRHFTQLSGEPNEIPLDEFIDLGDEERAGKIPFICATDDDMHLVKLRCFGDDRRIRRRPAQERGACCNT